MNVRELIEKLEHCPMTAEVMARSAYDDQSDPYDVHRVYRAPCGDVILEFDE